MVAKKTAAKRTPAAGSTGTAEVAEGVAGKRTTVAEPPTDAEKRPAAKKAAGKEPAAKKAPAKKAAGRKAAAKKTAAGAADADGTAPGAADGEAPAGKTVARKAAARKAPAKKQTGARTVAAKKTAGGVTTAEDGAAVPTARTGELAVRPGEDPWTPAEVTEARDELQSEVLRLRSELAHSQEELTGLMRDSGDGAGDDQADTGTKNITREHELALAANAREMLEQTEHALERLDAGTYGLCEVCGKPIGKARMQAFPRATLCVEDKQRQERRG
ncbi:MULTISPECIES: TraR/DksA C4-type zinc finger protein [unclassified Streptomyces]|uniref:TraR/DksA family transcriptional regulator n=1 Tax=unclassified Streptomyces TaxID=2593676 RepID=UPI0006FAC3D1|nr:MULTISPECIES: TraR/DksA C4-type zinc finger protein [unclassified Streptomyces]KQX53376.1 DNA-binding protein [Streptomyces sp. Root1304]KRA90294.1 DNA-binding protein [Streptomyces sp. Root66D1]